MEYAIRKLTPSMAEEYLYYFDHVGFSDHPEWSACYCLESHLDFEEEAALEGQGKEGRRNKAKELIVSGRMNGYLVYEGEKPVGWCNADSKESFGRISANPEYADKEVKGRIKAVYCFDIAPEYRGKGIASLLLHKVCEDAKKEGYEYVEGYPLKDQEGIFLYHGPMRLYEKAGFTLQKEIKGCYIMRKKL